MVVKGFINYFENGNCGIFGNFFLIVFDVIVVSITYQVVDMLPVMILGVIEGVLGVFYNYLLVKIFKFYALINCYVYLYTMMVSL